jgi:hypothetical protein
MFFLCLSIAWSKSPSSAYSITMHKWPSLSSKNASLYPITLTLFIDARILISFKAFSFSLSERLPNFTILIAYVDWSEILIAEWT